MHEPLRQTPRNVNPLHLNGNKHHSDSYIVVMTQSADRGRFIRKQYAEAFSEEDTGRVMATTGSGGAKTRHEQESRAFRARWDIFPVHRI